MQLVDLYMFLDESENEWERKVRVKFRYIVLSTKKAVLKVECIPLFLDYTNFKICHYSSFLKNQILIYFVKWKTFWQSASLKTAVLLFWIGKRNGLNGVQKDVIFIFIFLFIYIFFSYTHVYLANSNRYPGLQIGIKIIGA